MTIYLLSVIKVMKLLAIKSVAWKHSQTLEIYILLLLILENLIIIYCVMSFMNNRSRCFGLISQHLMIIYGIEIYSNIWRLLKLNLLLH